MKVLFFHLKPNHERFHDVKPRFVHVGSKITNVISECFNIDEKHVEKDQYQNYPTIITNSIVNTFKVPVGFYKEETAHT